MSSTNRKLEIGQACQYANLTNLRKTIKMKLNFISTALALLLIVGSLISCARPLDDIAAEPQVGNQFENSETPMVRFTLKTISGEGKLVYMGIGGEIDGVINPDLNVQPGTVVNIILINGDGMPHDLFLPEFDVRTAYVTKIEEKTEIVFEVGNSEPGKYVYYCTVPGHRQAGQEGQLIVN